MQADVDGNAAFELIEIGSTAEGINRLAKAIIARQRSVSCVYVDGQSGAPTLLFKLKDTPKNYVFAARPANIVSAAGMLLDGMREHTVFHTRFNQDALNDSALGSEMRPIGKSGGWGFDSTDEVESIAIEAASLAVLGARTTKRDPRQRQEIL